MKKNFLYNLISIESDEYKFIAKVFGLKFSVKTKLGKQRSLLSKIQINIDSNPKYALKLLKTYLNKYNLSEIADVLKVANFAYENNFKNEDIEKSAFIYRQLKQNLKKKSLEKYLKGKIVAIVGNSNYEIGTGHGKEIDSHDVVVKFNNYPDNFINDYGEQCNIWVRGFGKEGEILDRDLKKYDYVILGPLTAGAILPSFIKTWLYESIKKYPEKILCYDPSFRTNELPKYGIEMPTNGFLAIVYIKSIVPIKNIKVYGFSFLNDEGKEDNTHFYDDKSTISFHKSMDYERNVLRKLFKQNL